jgi:hypothetical protein
MTKRVRVENADSSNYRVAVEVYQTGYPDGAPDVLVETRVLTHACDLADFYIHAGRYIKVRELGPVSV